MPIKTVSLVAGKNQNTVINYLGKEVEHVKEDGSLYFEKEVTFMSRPPMSFFEKVASILHVESSKPMFTSGYTKGTAGKGTIRPNTILQDSLESLCKSENVSFEYFTDLVKSFINGLNITTPFDYESAIAEANAAFEADLHKIRESAVLQAADLGITITLESVDVTRPSFANLYAQAESAHIERLKKVETARKTSESLKNKNS